MRILLIEDNESIADVMRRSLLVFNSPADRVELDCAANGRTGLQLARSSTFDGYLVDLDLPDIHGLQVGLALGHLMRRQRIPNGWIAAVTAQSDAITRQRAQDLGFNAFLTKPFGISALNALLHHFGAPKAQG